MNRFWLSQRVHSAGGSGAASPRKNWKFDQLQGILGPYEMSIRVYSKVNVKYFNPLTYDSISKIVLF